MLRCRLYIAGRLVPEGICNQKGDGVMHPHPVVIFDIITFLACLTALVFLCKSSIHAKQHRTQLLFSGLLVFTLLCYSFCLILEWSRVTSRLDILENFIGVLAPMWWAFVFYAFLKEITEKNLRESEARLYELFDEAPIGYHELDTEGRITHINKTELKMLGYKYEEMLGRPVWEFVIEEETSRQAVIDKLSGAIPPGQALERTLRQKNGNTLPVLCEDRLLHDDFGNITGIRSTIQNISKRKQAEYDREQLMETLASKNKELESILYVTSHDLRAPLVNIQGFSHELSLSCEQVRSALRDRKKSADTDEKLQTALNKDIPEALGFITNSASRMESLLSGLLRLSRLGTAALNIESLDMNTLLADVTKSTEYQIKQAGATVKVEPLPPCRGDSSQINQVFTNILNNALKYLDDTRPGMIRVYAKAEYRRNVYCVEDNGVGIAPDHKEKIFEIFYRLEPDKKHGEGLGLTIVKHILERHNGNIRVESKPGVGSKFFISLPSV